MAPDNHADVTLPVLLTSTALHQRLHPDLRRGSWKNWLHNAIKRHGFPAGVRLGARQVSWRSDEVLRWIESRPRGGRFGGSVS